VRKTLPSDQIYPFVISLYAQPCPFSHGAACVDISWLDCGWWSIVWVFSFFSLSWQLKCIIVPSLFIVCLGLTWISKSKDLESGKHARPKLLESDYHIRPKSLGSWLIFFFIIKHWIDCEFCFIICFLCGYYDLMTQVTDWQVNSCWLGSIQYIVVSFFFKKKCYLESF
jgi:hypothetical protein